MVDGLQQFTESLPPLLQWAGVTLAGAIPFIESYFGSVIGVIAGVTLPVAIGAAVVGNIASMIGFVFTADRVRTRVKSRTASGNIWASDATEPERPVSRRRRKLRRAFDRYGVAGVSLFGQTILPSQITSATLVSFGARRDAVILWQTISICLWGIAFGALAAYGIDMTRA